jgi:hypothetical protein
MKELACIKGGRAGDILGILPCLKYLSEIGSKPTLIVSREYSHAARYCGYINVEESPMPFEACIRMEAKARKEYKIVHDFSVYGHGLAYDRVATHFTAEAHHRADRRLGRMYDQGHFRKLVFDKPIQTPSLISATQGPTVVICFNGNSSPLPHADGWRQFISEGLNRAGIGVCDVSHVKLPTIVDLLPTLNAAKAVLSIDTAILHLMAASPTPYVALRNDLFGGDKWFCAPIHSNCAMGIYYSEAPNKSQQVLDRLIELCQ